MDDYISLMILFRMGQCIIRFEFCGESYQKSQDNDCAYSCFLPGKKREARGFSVFPLKTTFQCDNNSKENIERKYQ